MQMKDKDKKYGVYTVMKDERIKKGISLRELAKILDVNYSSVQLWENRKRVPSIEYAHKIEWFFGIPIKELQRNLSIPEEEKGINK